MAFGAVAGAVGNELLGAASSIGGAAFNAAMTRSLRRTAYQDQMHSMRQAGLNPILAAGAQPGYANTGTANVKTDIAGSAQRLAEVSKLPQQKAVLAAQNTQALASARQAEAQADTAEAIRDAQVEELRERAAGHRAGAFKDTTGGYENQADTGLKTAEREAGLPEARADLARRQSDRISADLLSGLPAAVAEANRRAAGLSSAREEGTRYENVSKGVDARWVKDFEGMIRAGKTADEIIDRLGPVADILLRGRGQVLGDRRDRRTDARQRERNYEAEREQDRRDRYEFRNFPGMN